MDKGEEKLRLEQARINKMYRDALDAAVHILATLPGKSTFAILLTDEDGHYNGYRFAKHMRRYSCIGMMEAYSAVLKQSEIDQWNGVGQSIEDNSSNSALD